MLRAQRVEPNSNPSCIGDWYLLVGALVKDDRFSSSSSLDSRPLPDFHIQLLSVWDIRQTSSNVYEWLNQWLLKIFSLDRYGVDSDTHRKTFWLVYIYQSCWISISVPRKSIKYALNAEEMLPIIRQRGDLVVLSWWEGNVPGTLTMNSGDS